MNVNLNSVKDLQNTEQFHNVALAPLQEIFILTFFKKIKKAQILDIFCHTLFISTPL